MIHQALYGLNLGMAFAPNHKGMLMPEPGTKMDHLHKQVLTSRDVSGGWLVDQFLGGLNYQIEHHLFPSIPRPHLRLAQPMIRDYCLIQGLPFRNVGFVASYVECLDHLRSVGDTAGREIWRSRPTPRCADAACGQRAWDPSVDSAPLSSAEQPHPPLGGCGCSA